MLVHAATAARTELNAAAARQKLKQFISGVTHTHLFAHDRHPFSCGRLPDCLKRADALLRRA